ncbi:NrdH [Mycobacterium phage Kratio]|uniref:NrdH-like glutaredoxin n=2 Tax=Kratiovirus TaxID=2948788 RepID=A0A385DX74_9CAUD|nr:NrdH [Mycobacterium phage Kratio]YP_009950676.1 NrdH-like glutaredoxin [Mycobacterium phage Collard]AJK27387.1 NrdH-like glutaredoxin [Mycobacterium phage Kratio]AXQ63232.1 NrdH-like glutaredoxin [Mycobacterium phage Collard]UEM46452.1 NrdH-like glutaredoxin [Mycobacterium phage InvictusManeo]
MITIYTTGPECYKCKLTKDRFEKAGVAVNEIQLDQVDKSVTAQFMAAGHTSAPVVVDELTETWSDMRPDKIRAALVARGINP